MASTEECAVVTNPRQTAGAPIEVLLMVIRDRGALLIEWNVSGGLPPPIPPPTLADVVMVTHWFFFLRGGGFSPCAAAVEM